MKIIFSELHSKKKIFITSKTDTKPYSNDYTSKKNMNNWNSNSQKIVHKQGGQIWADSKMEKVLIPLYDTNQKLINYLI